MMDLAEKKNIKLTDRHSLNILKFLMFSGLVMFVLGSFIFRVRAANPPGAMITIDSPLVFDTTYESSGPVVRMSGTVTTPSGGITVIGLTVSVDSPSITPASVSWISGDSRWTGAVDIHDSGFALNSTTSVFLTATTSNGMTTVQRFAIKKSATIADPTPVSCTVGGTVRDKITNNPLGGADVYIRATPGITQTLKTGIDGKYNTPVATPFVTNAGSSVTATAYFNGYSPYVDNTRSKEATNNSSTCVLNLDDIKLAPISSAGGNTGGGSGGNTGVGNGNNVVQTTPIKKVYGKTLSSLDTSSPIQGATVTLSVSLVTGGISLTATSGVFGDYNFDLSGLSVVKGSQITLNSAKKGYIQSRTSPVTLPSIPDNGEFPAINIYMKPPLATISGVVTKQYSTKSVPAQNSLVSLSCDGAGGGSAFTDSSGKYSIIADINFPNCNISASIDRRSDLSSSPFKFVLPSAPGVITTNLVINVSADLTLTANFQALYDNFFADNYDKVDSLYQPESGSPRVAFPITFKQNGLNTEIKPAQQSSGPFKLTGLDATAPYNIHIEPNINSIYGNKALDLDSTKSPGALGSLGSNPYTLKAGPNSVTLEVSPDDPNHVTFNINDVKGNADQIYIRVKKTSTDPTPLLLDRKTKSDLSIWSTDHIYSFLENGLGEVESDGSSEKKLPWSKDTYVVGASTGPTSPILGQYVSFGFDRYFGSFKAVDIKVDTAKVSGYKLSGTVYETYDCDGTFPKKMAAKTTVALIGTTGSTETVIDTRTITDGQGKYSFDNIPYAKTTSYEKYKLKTTEPSHTTSIITINFAAEDTDIKRNPKLLSNSCPATFCPAQ